MAITDIAVVGSVVSLVLLAGAYVYYRSAFAKHAKQMDDDRPSSEDGSAKDAPRD